MDASFDVDGTIVYACKLIISLCATAFFELTKNNSNNNNNNNDNGNVISNTNIESDTFKWILKHVYTVKTTMSEVKYDDNITTKLLFAADHLSLVVLH